MNTLATPANMRRFEVPGKTIPAPDGVVVVVEAVRPIAYSPTTGEEYSGTADDYFWQPQDSPVLDREGNPMILVFKRTVYVDAKTGEEL